MTSHKKPYRIILSGGGTGGHIFPAVSIADELRRRHPDADILFVGAQGRMEMTRVPEAGYRIVGLPIAGIQRSLSLSNLAVPFKVISSLWRARSIVRRFRPDVVIGTGGYASAPVLFAASLAGVPTLIQEQNGFAGLTNRILSHRARVICVAYEGLEKVFPREKIVFTGNPVRSSITDAGLSQRQAKETFGLNTEKKTFLVLGGSLGARAINEAVYANLDIFLENSAQLLWQCGRTYYARYREMLDRLIEAYPDKHYGLPGGTASLYLRDGHRFCGRGCRDLPFGGGYSVGTLHCGQTGHPHPFAQRGGRPPAAQCPGTFQPLGGHPDPGERKAAFRVGDAVMRLIKDPALCQDLSRNISEMARPHATSDIVDQVEKLLKEKR